MTLIRSTGFLRDLGCNSEGASRGALSSLRALQWILLAEFRKEYNRRPGTPTQAFLECLQASVTLGPLQWPLGAFLPPPKVQLCQNRKAALFPVLKSLHMHFGTAHTVGIQAESPKELFPAQALWVLGWFWGSPPMVSRR